ncbi:hypothetical protein NSU_2826 [Novosphingobium pentaromativorans US6-1]|uniref:Uncharacterized protein n=2 Tax=Novosphingobium pentaromativorans TaxID=205844 RepID=G6EEQ5_9SPHN|nr:hypothetical protein NSU_2826 [Novosphingobium pentaromativorans US6-1]
MRKSMKKISSLVAIGLALSSPAAYAHHSFNMFDSSKYVEFDGVVKTFTWRNPHVMITVQAGNKVWTVECSTPNIIGRKGWSPTVMKAGDKIRFRIHPRKDGSDYGLAVSARLPNGTIITDKP